MKKLFLAAIVSLISMMPLAAQNQMSPEEKEKKLSEFIQKEVDKFETSLKLEDWQVFYADSILNHDYRAMQDELDEQRQVVRKDIRSHAQDPRRGPVDEISQDGCSSRKEGQGQEKGQKN